MGRMILSIESHRYFSVQTAEELPKDRIQLECKVECNPYQCWNEAFLLQDYESHSVIV
jgi:hypothetical protein